MQNCNLRVISECVITIRNLRFISNLVNQIMEYTLRNYDAHDVITIFCNYATTLCAGADRTPWRSSRWSLKRQSWATYWFFLLVKHSKVRLASMFSHIFFVVDFCIFSYGILFNHQIFVEKTFYIFSKKNSHMYILTRVSENTGTDSYRLPERPRDRYTILIFLSERDSSVRFFLLIST